MKKVLITGAAGYIGSVLVRLLLKHDYKVVGYDSLFFGGESLLDVFNDPNFEFINGDIRDKKNVKNALKSVESVVHLAAIVGDPACSKQPELAREINWDATKMLFDLCNETGSVERFIFASTCSNYGKMKGGAFVNENSELHPVSLYAELKVKFENYLLESNTRKDFIPTALRFATVYGISPRMRFDLTVNEFTRELSLGKELIVFGEQFWRPYCHVRDLALSCVKVLQSPTDLVDHEVYGVGNTNENYQKKTIVKEILKIIPEGKVKYVRKEEDPRDYRVDFSKIKEKLNFQTTKTIGDGIKEITKLLNDKILINPYSEMYSNI